MSAAFYMMGLGELPPMIPPVISPANFPPVVFPRWFTPGNSPRWSPPDLESLQERMKRLDLSKPVTRRLTPGSNYYTNPNTIALQDPHDT